MKKFVYTITDPAGIHARPAGLLVKESGKFASTVMIKKGEKTADCKKIFSLMGLGIKKDETIEVQIEGSDEDAANTVLETFFKTNL